MKFTILGASGFIGSHLVKQLESRGIEVFSPSRESALLFKKDLRHVIYAVGLTADFREKPFETVEAHVCYLMKILEKTSYDSFLYLSSTRLYQKGATGSEEDDLKANPLDSGDLYNISKMMGESLCFASPHSGVRVVRLSNVYGPDFSSRNFLSSVIRDAVGKKRVVLEISEDSEKDHVSVKDVAELLPKIAFFGKQRLYNAAGGANVSNGALLEIVQKQTGCSIEVKEGAPVVSFPRISIERIKEEFGFSPSLVLDDLPGLIQEYRKSL